MDVVDMIDDLKQFIDARISQSERRFDEKLDQRISQTEARFDRKLDALRDEMQEGFASVAEVTGTLIDRTDQLEARVSKLEQQAA